MRYRILIPTRRTPQRIASHRWHMGKMEMSKCPATFTNHGYPWALIRRAGDAEGKRPSTRVAFLVDTVVGGDGKAVALRGYIARNDMTGWTKSLRRVEWSDIVRSWRRQPDVTVIRAIKRRMPKVISNAEAAP